MTTRREFLVLLGAASVSLGEVRAASGDLAVIAHPSAPVRSLSELELEAIFLTNRRYWSGTDAIVPFNLPPGNAARILFDRTVLRMDPDEVGRHWLDRRVRGGAPPPRQAPDASILSRLVSRLDGAIGYVPEELAGKDVRVVARIRDRKVVSP